MATKDLALFGVKVFLGELWIGQNLPAAFVVELAHHRRHDAVFFEQHPQRTNIQALIVFQQAAQLWAAQLSSSVEIKVDSRFQPLACMTNSGTLGSAGPVNAYRDFTNAPLPGTFYAVALANSLFGSDIAPATSDISMQFYDLAQ